MLFAISFLSAFNEIPKKITNKIKYVRMRIREVIEQEVFEQKRAGEDIHSEWQMVEK